ncbi:hypothetical protein BX600DRAFT_554341 [Xylariales sp. PMI_506]|nr:hypothetical protein BX600DRAFT_554341 [Xylariales sp. PMI_506]
MAANVTSQSGFNMSPTEVPQASGQSIFWALVTLAFFAMQQPSFCGYLWGGNAFETSIWPHRSLPTLCILDTVADAWILVDKYRSRGSDKYGEAPAAKPTDITMRLTVFLVGVLPQAIKLFSMKGIPLTQALAAVFLVSSLVSMTRTTCMDSPHEDLSKLINAIKTSRKSRRSRVLTGILGWGLHGVGLLLIWYQMSDKARISTTEDATNVVQWISTISILGFGIYIIQHVFTTMIGVKPKIPYYPLIMICMVTDNFGIWNVIVVPEARDTRTWKKYCFAGTLLFDVLLYFYAVTASLMHWRFWQKLYSPSPQK